jgi:hypothetical protein
MPHIGILEMAVTAERERLYKLLKSLGVLRDSMLGDDWKVIYSETGPIDIHLDRLDGTIK